MHSGGENGTRGRRRLWEITGGYHCSILGTCLSLERTERILRKAKVPALSRMSDYEAHCVAVEGSKVRGPLARLIQKALDRTHETSLRRYARLTGASALRLAWREDFAAGKIAGPYWALMSHPDVDDALAKEAFGRIHMLSHRLGKGHRVRSEQAESLELRLEKSETARIRDASAHRTERAHLENRIRELEAELADRAIRLAEAEARSPAGFEALKTALGQAERARARAERRIEHLQSRLVSEPSLPETPPAAPPIQPALAVVSSPETAPRTCPRPERAEERCADCDLRGDVILYVGGERGMLPHLRRLAKAANGRLLHHDGGREDRLATLARLCARADAVLCPVDRVGHAAVEHVKRACNRTQRAFIPLRRSSVEAFEQGLRTFSAARAPSPSALEAEINPSSKSEIAFTEGRRSVPSP